MGERGLVVVMGSGETAPSMVTVHQRALAAAPPDTPAVLLDSPYGFQGNADDLTARTFGHFRERVGRELSVCSFRSAAAAAADPLAYEQALALLREAGWAYAGPGSPSYTLRTWAGTPVPELLARVVERGGVLTFSSAAALTLGVATVPVYEIYKVGHDPHWLDGLDLLGRLVGLRAALIPHWDNAEGGTHDTRFCYLGEARLHRLEAELAEGTCVIGVDEHTALLLDLGAGSATVAGRGGVVVRIGGVEVLRLSSGSSIPLAQLREAAEGRMAGQSTGRPVAGSGSVRVGRAGDGDGEVVGAAEGGRAGSANAGEEADIGGTSSFGAEGAADSAAGTKARAGFVGDSATVAEAGAGARSVLAELNGASLGEDAATAEAAFAAALSARDADAALAAVLALETALDAWAADPTQSDERSQARATLRGIVTRLAQVATEGLVDRRDIVAPFVEALLDLRLAARADKRWADADAIRDTLVAATIEIRDRPGATDWSAL